MEGEILAREDEGIARPAGITRCGVAMQGYETKMLGVD